MDAKELTLLVELLTREVVTLRERLEHQSGNGRSAATGLVLREALDRLLQAEGGKSVSVKHLAEKVRGLVNGAPSAASVRGTLNEHRAAYGWHRKGEGRGTRWLKPQAQEALVLASQ